MLLLEVVYPAFDDATLDASISFPFASFIPAVGMVRLDGEVLPGYYKQCRIRTFLPSVPCCLFLR